MSFGPWSVLLCWQSPHMALCRLMVLGWQKEHPQKGGPMTQEQHPLPSTEGRQMSGQARDLLRQCWISREILICYVYSYLLARPVPKKVAEYSCYSFGDLEI